MVTEAAIIQLRSIRKPVAVRLHHIPKWFLQKLYWWLRLHDVSGSISIADPLGQFAKINNWRLDHWGSSESGSVFVNGPYGDSVEQNKMIAEMLHCDFTNSDNSYWYPGRTSRYEFRWFPAPSYLGPFGA